MQQWFKWLTDEDELDVDPMAKMKAPQVPEQPVPVLTAEQMRALFATCERGKQFIDRRDHANAIAHQRPQRRPAVWTGASQ